jgi:anti-sigma B factor antagonist
MPPQSSRPISIASAPVELVVGTRENFKRTMLAYLDAGNDTVVDFTGTRYLDSSGLGALLSVTKKYHDAGRRLVLVGLNEDLETLLELTKTDGLFERYLSVDAAQAALRQAA